MGDYRVIYQIQGATVIIIKIDHRKEVYKKFTTPIIYVIPRGKYLCVDSIEGIVAMLFSAAVKAFKTPIITKIIEAMHYIDDLPK